VSGKRFAAGAVCKKWNDISVMARLGMTKSMRLWLTLLALAATALLFWLEYLGSEQPLKLREIPVVEPADKTGLQN
jgi:hypothetical protein